MLGDGSIKDRTTRGNKGLWHHHAGLIETIVTIEMARKHGLKIPVSLERRIERAGEIFIKGFEDHSYMDKWAKVAHRGVFTPGNQDFREDLNLPNGNSWLYIFSYRYPDSDFTKRLGKIITQYPKKWTDGWLDWLWFGLYLFGCQRSP